MFSRRDGLFTSAEFSFRRILPSEIRFD